MSTRVRRRICRNCWVMCERISHTVHSLRNATLANWFRRVTSVSTSYGIRPVPGLHFSWCSYVLFSTYWGWTTTPPNSLGVCVRCRRGMHQVSLWSLCRRHIQRRWLWWHLLAGASRGVTEGHVEQFGSKLWSEQDWGCLLCKSRMWGDRCWESEALFE